MRNAARSSHPSFPGARAGEQARMATRHGAQPPSAEPFVALGEGPVTGCLRALSLLRARNRGYYVRPTRNALRGPRNRHVIGLLRAHYVHVIGFVTTWHVMGT